MYCDFFSYDGRSCEDYNLVIGSFDGAENGEIESGSLVTMDTIKAPHSNTFLKANSTYNDQLVITFSILKLNCNNMNDKYFSQREIGAIMKWLARKDYHKLSFEQEGWIDIYYNAKCDVKQYMAGGQCIGFQVTATCDAPWGYKDRIMNITFDNANENNFQTIVLNIPNDDEIGLIYPDVDIAISNTQGSFELKNLTTGSETKINNIKNGEEILMRDHTIMSSKCQENESSNFYSYTGDHSTFYDDFNWEWFTIGNTDEMEIFEYDMEGNDSDEYRLMSYNLLGDEEDQTAYKFVIFDTGEEDVDTYYQNTITCNCPCTITLRWRAVKKGVV